MKLVEPGYQVLSSINESAIYRAIELAGRTAYKSEDRITEGSAEKFIRMVVKRGHESVLEHVNLSVKFVTDRGVTHELVRHRLVSYTQESTRYCNYRDTEVTCIRQPFWGKYSEGHRTWYTALSACEDAYIKLIDLGATPEQARSVLPNSLKTEIVCTANIREWRHILTLRCSKRAHPQMRQLMLPLLHELKEKLPVLFEDVPEE